MKLVITSMLALSFYSAFSLYAALKNEATFVNHSGGPILINLKCFEHIGEPGEDFVIAPDESKDFVITCPDRDAP